MTTEEQTTTFSFCFRGSSTVHSGAFLPPRRPNLPYFSRLNQSAVFIMKAFAISVRPKIFDVFICISYPLLKKFAKVVRQHLRNCGSIPFMVRNGGLFHKYWSFGCPLWTSDGIDPQFLCSFLTTFANIFNTGYEIHIEKRVGIFYANAEGTLTISRPECNSCIRMQANQCRFLTAKQIFWQRLIFAKVPMIAKALWFNYLTLHWLCVKVQTKTNILQWKTKQKRRWFCLSLSICVSISSAPLFFGARRKRKYRCYISNTVVNNICLPASCLLGGTDTFLIQQYCDSYINEKNSVRYVLEIHSVNNKF